MPFCPQWLRIAALDTVEQKAVASSHDTVHSIATLPPATASLWATACTSSFKGTDARDQEENNVTCGWLWSSTNFINYVLLWSNLTHFSSAKVLNFKLYHFARPPILLINFKFCPIKLRTLLLFLYYRQCADSAVNREQGDSWRHLDSAAATRAPLLDRYKECSDRQLVQRGHNSQVEAAAVSDNWELRDSQVEQLRVQMQWSQQVGPSLLL